jgi:protein-tyrosine phosphatase
VKEIFWIRGESAPHLAIVLCPRGVDWLEGDLLRIKQGGIETVVSLLEPVEAILLGLGDEAGAAARVGLQFLSYPITDGHVPGDIAAFRKFAEGIADRLAAGEYVGVHCLGSIGRSTIAAACALLHLGWKPSAALSAIAKARGESVPGTPEQKEWILRYTPRHSMAQG